MKKNQIYNSLIGLIGLTISVIIIINFSEYNIQFQNFVENYISQDNSLSPKSKLFLSLLFSLTLGLIVLLSLAITFKFLNPIRDLLTKFFALKNHPSGRLTTVKSLDMYILIFGVIVSIIQITILISVGEQVGEIRKPQHEGILEKIFAVVLLISAVLIIFSIGKLKSLSMKIKHRRVGIITLILIMIFIIIFLGEEISWGQRIFNIESQGVFQEYNLQNETNIHNFIDPQILVGVMYPTISIVIFTILIAIWLFPSRRKSYIFDLLFPHPTLFFIILIMTIVSFFGGGGETFEQLFTTIILFYSLRIFVSLSKPNLDRQNIMINEKTN